MALKVAFAGTPQLAAQSLSALLGAEGIEVPIVLTRPDKPFGRGRKLRASPVKETALAAGVEVYQPKTLKSDEARERLASLRPDFLAVAAYGLILPPWALAWPKRACVNVHASLLPRWRGAAPAQRAVEAGDPVTGVCLMVMDEGLDTGDVIARREMPLPFGMTGGEALDALGRLGASMLPDALLGFDKLARVKQPDEGALYASKIEKSEAKIDWALDALAVARKVLAFDPAPGCHALREGRRIKLFAPNALPGAPGAAPGTVLAVGPQGVEVACATGSVLFGQLQSEGGKRLRAADFLRGNRVEGGETWA